MNLMAGFDLVIELSNDIVLKLIRAGLLINGHLLNPPFDLTLPLQDDSSTYIHCIVTELQLDLDEGDTITLDMIFDRGTAVISSPFSTTIGPLSGTIHITNIILGTSSLSFDLSAASATFRLSPESEAELIESLKAQPFLTPDLIKDLANQEFSNYVQTLSIKEVPLPFIVMPGIDGSISSPILQLESVEIHCISNIDKSKQALGIFGILIASNHGHGSHALRKSTAITSSPDGLCISLSPEVINALVITPVMAKQAADLDTKGMTLSNFTTSFSANQINLDGTISKKGTCYEAVGTFHGFMTAVVDDDNKISFLSTMDPIVVDMEIPWYCYLAAGIFGTLGPIITAAVDKMIDGISLELSKSLVIYTFPSFGNAMLTASFRTSQISNEGMSLNGMAMISLPTSSDNPHLVLDGSVFNTDTVVIKSELWKHQVWCMDPKDYPIVETQQSQCALFTLTSVLTILPLTPVFSLVHAGITYPLTGDSGKITIPNMPTNYPMPLDSGGHILHQVVHIDYSVSVNQVELRNDPTEGNFTFFLQAKAKDIDDNFLSANNSELEVIKTVMFEGDHVEVSGGFEKDVQSCVAFMADWVRQTYKTNENEFPKWPSVPSPEGLHDFITQVSQLGYPELDQVLANARVAHNCAYFSAILSPSLYSKT